jgi:hypothetical protein
LYAIADPFSCKAKLLENAIALAYNQPASLTNHPSKPYGYAVYAVTISGVALGEIGSKCNTIICSGRNPFLTNDRTPHAQTQNFLSSQHQFSENKRSQKYPTRTANSNADRCQIGMEREKPESIKRLLP